MAVTVLLFAFWLRVTNHDAVGLGDPHYTATVRSMLISARNFLFVAGEPGGSIGVAKPPLGMWLQTLSAAAFGFHMLAIIFPQIASGLMSVALLYRLVGRSFGRLTGLLAAFILATTPINVAIERNNVVDAPMILLLLFAAGAFLRAAETDSRRWLVAGGVLVGLAFNVKTLHAFIPLPALLVVYLLEPHIGWQRKVVGLIGCMAVIVVVGLSWIAVFDLIPPNQRPYVGDSPANSALELALGFHGALRLFGGRSVSIPVVWIPGQGFIEPPANLEQLVPPINPETGLPGPLRLFVGPLNNEIGWLLPLGALGLILLLSLAWRSRSAKMLRQWGLWGGWLLAGGTVLSAAAFIHPHYTATLSPALAALAAIALQLLWQLYRDRVYVGLVILAAVASGLVVWQAGIALQYIWDAPWILTLAGPLLVVGLIGLTVSQRQIAPIAFAFVTASVLITPVLWSVLTTIDEAPGQILPRAYAGYVCIRDRCTPPGQFRTGASVQQMLARVPLEPPSFDPILLDYLQAHTQDVEYLVAVTDAFAGSEYVIATGRPVLYVRGTIGADNIADQHDLARMVEEGRLRFVLWPEAAPPGAPPDPILGWLQNECQRVFSVDVPDLSTPPFYRGLYRCDPAG